MATMRAAVFHGPGDIRVDEVPRPTAGPGEAVIRVTLTTICGTDVHIMKGEYAVEPGLVVGHEPVGVIDELGPGLVGYEVGERVLVGAITPCGQCHACLSGKSEPVRARLRLSRPSAAGASATRSTGRRPNTCSSRTRRPTWRRSPSRSPMSRSSSWRTSPPPASPAPSRARSASATPSSSSPKARSGYVRPQVRS